MTTLDRKLLAAHEVKDRVALAHLYGQAAEVANDPDASGFYLTHAYVFALEAGLPEATTLRDRLVSMGRESPLQGDTTI